MQQLTELQEKWLKALESGEYEQGRSKLKKGNAFCCLGVACVVAGKEFSATDSCEGQVGTLPQSVVDAMRLCNDSGEVPTPFLVGGDEHYMLTTANDTGHSFLEIAAAIRAHPENFFLPPEAP